MRRSPGSCAVALALLGAASTAAQSTTTPTTSTSTPIPVVGLKIGIDKQTGQPPSRLEINGFWARGGPQWDLYILALSELQDMDETDESSYFAIAGIHGLPYSAWNGVGNVDGAPIGGWCPHGELLFTTWHRPYIALFEQVLVARAVDIASRYPSDLRPQYVAAAETLRQPYWDWPSSATLPVAVTSANVTVAATPEGRGPKVIRNPLYSYRFQHPNLVRGWGGYLSNFSDVGTIRCPRSDDVTRNNATASDEGLRSVAADLTNGVYDILTRVKTFDEMKISTFEIPHNNVHMKAACNKGTLADLNWAAFEPLFMLHHTNIDRLLALWQAINYKSPMFTGTAVSNGQMGTLRGTIVTADSPLKPFYRVMVEPDDDDNNNKGNGNYSLTFHTSNSVANISVFGYTYPELPPFSLDPEARASHVRAEINSLYAAGVSSRVGRPRSGMNKIGGGGGGGGGGGEEGGEGPVKDYYAVKVSLDRGEILKSSSKTSGASDGGGGGGVTVGLYVVGQKVGDMSVLGMPCEGTLEGWIPLGDVRLSNNQSLFDDENGENAGAVVGVLLQELRVGIQTTDGTELDVGSVPSLKLTLQDMQYIPRGGNSGSGNDTDTTGDDVFPEFNGKSASWAVDVRGMN